MKKVVPAETVAHLFIHKAQDEARTPGAANFFFTGPTLYSYGRHYVAAHWLDEALPLIGGRLLVNSMRYSPTTGRHLDFLRRAMPAHVKAEAIRVPGMSEDDVRRLEREIKARELPCLAQHLMMRARDALKSAAKKRPGYGPFDDAIRQARELHAVASLFAASAGQARAVPAFPDAVESQADALAAAALIDRADTLTNAGINMIQARRALDAATGNYDAIQATDTAADIRAVILGRLDSAPDGDCPVSGLRQYRMMADSLAAEANRAGVSIDQARALYKAAQARTPAALVKMERELAALKAEAAPAEKARQLMTAAALDMVSAQAAARAVAIRRGKLRSTPQAPEGLRMEYLRHASARENYQRALATLGQQKARLIKSCQAAALAWPLDLVDQAAAWADDLIRQADRAGRQADAMLVEGQVPNLLERADTAAQVIARNINAAAADFAEAPYWLTEAAMAARQCSEYAAAAADLAVKAPYLARLFPALAGLASVNIAQLDELRQALYARADAIKAECDREARDAWISGASNRRPSGTYARIVGDQVETSRGASVPLDHACRLARLWRVTVRKGGATWGHADGPRVGFFRLTHIGADGATVIGCHRFDAQEANRMASLLMACADCQGVTDDAQGVA